MCCYLCLDCNLTAFNVKKMQCDVQFRPLSFHLDLYHFNKILNLPQNCRCVDTSVNQSQECICSSVHYLFSSLHSLSSCYSEVVRGCSAFASKIQEDLQLLNSNTIQITCACDVNFAGLQDDACLVPEQQVASDTAAFKDWLNISLLFSLYFLLAFIWTTVFSFIHNFISCWVPFYIFFLFFYWFLSFSECSYRSIQ